MAVKVNLRNLLVACLFVTFILIAFTSLNRSTVEYQKDGPEEGRSIFQLSYHHSSYLLALGYSEQISAGIHSVLQLSSLALDFRAHLVEPTVVTSHIFGIQGVYPWRYSKNISNEAAVKLFYLLDKSKVNKFLHKNLSSSVNMSSYSYFLRAAPRKITIFHFSSPNLVKSDRLFTLLPHQETEILEYFKKNSNTYLNCLNFSGMRDISNMVENQLKIDGRGMRTQTLFKVSEVFCLNHNHIYRSDELFQLIPEPRTIIFTNWGGCGLKDCTHRSKDVMREKAAMSKVPLIRHAVLTHKKLNCNLKYESKLHHKRVKSAAERYLKHLGFSPSEFISVHIRMERIIRYTMEFKNKTNYTQYYNKCYGSILSTINNFFHETNTTSDGSSQYRGSYQVLATSDRPGLEFGTDTCIGRYCNSKEVEVLRSILKKGLDFHSFKPGVLDEVPNAGLVSLVEMHLLSMGRKLVLVGFGGFQAVLKNLFLSLNHTEEDISHICNFTKR